PDAPTLFDLRCFVREGLIAWLHEYAPQALPRTRTASLVRMEGDEGRAMPSPQPTARPERSMPARFPPARTEPRQPDQRGPRPADAEPSSLPPGVVRRRSARVATRAGAEVPPGPRPDDTQRIDIASDSSMFTGSIEAIERSRAFAGPGEDVIAEREANAADQASGRTGEQPVLGPDGTAVIPPPDDRRLATGDSAGGDTGGDGGDGDGDGGHGGGPGGGGGHSGA
ncbi:hypothetical protein ACGIF2_15835, partial [Cellulomonas sp. P22]